MVGLACGIAKSRKLRQANNGAYENLNSGAITYGNSPPQYPSTNQNNNYDPNRNNQIDYQPNYGMGQPVYANQDTGR